MTADTFEHRGDKARTTWVIMNFECGNSVRFEWLRLVEVLTQRDASRLGHGVNKGEIN